MSKGYIASRLSGHVENAHETTRAALEALEGIPDDIVKEILKLLPSFVIGKALQEFVGVEAEKRGSNRTTWTVFVVKCLIAILEGNVASVPSTVGRMLVMEAWKPSPRTRELGFSLPAVFTRLLRSLGLDVGAFSEELSELLRGGGYSQLLIPAGEWAAWVVTPRHGNVPVIRFKADRRSLTVVLFQAVMLALEKAGFSTNFRRHNENSFTLEDFMPRPGAPARGGLRRPRPAAPPEAA